MSGWREQGMGVGPISHQEILAWTILTGIKVTPTEVQAFKRVDSVFREYHYKKHNPDRPLGSIGSQLQAIKSEADRSKEQSERARARANAKAIEKAKPI